MYTANYELKDAGRFFLKRMVRMAPPAWISILIIFAIYFAALYMNGRPIEGMTWPGTSLKAILSNLLFSFEFMGVQEYIEVYWTLEVEFQFYLLIPFLLPLIVKFSHNQFILSLILLGISCTYFIYPDRILFFKNNSFFLLGLLLFLYRMNLVTRNYFIYAAGLAAIACYLQIGISAACASVISVFIIAFVKFQNPITNFLGIISFSLYITHHNTGIVAEFILRNFYGPDPSEMVKFVMFFVYLGLAITFAWIFYKVVEEPFMNMSKKVRIKSKNYKKQPVTPVDKK